MKSTATITRAQAKKLYPDNLVMVSSEFGFDMFICKEDNSFGFGVTDKKEDAINWSELDGSKLEYHKSVTGYAGLKFEKA